MTDVRIFRTIPTALYDELSQLEGVTVYHTSSWHRVLTRTFGWRVSALTVDDEFGCCWLLPFVPKRRLGKNINVCLPLSPCVGPAHRSTSCNINQDLSGTVWPLEIHAPVRHAQLVKLAPVYRTMIDLRPYETEEAILKIFHPRHIHRKIRKAQESGLTVRKGSSARDFEQFHALQVQTRHRQGSPTFPKSMFQHVFEEMHESNLAHLYLVCQNELVISGTIFFHFGDTATYAYGASLSNRDYWQLGVNQLAMWHGIRDAFRTGKARIDLGTTPIHQHGLRTYKERWGGETELYQFSYGAKRPEDLQIVRTAGSARVASWILARIPERLFERISSRLMRAVT